MYYEWVQANKRIIATCTAVFFVGIIVWSVTTYVSRIGKVSVTVSAVPSDATILINGKKVGNGTHWIAPGKYTFSAQKDGFKKREKTSDIVNEKNHNVVALSLTPESDTAKKWVESHDMDYKKNEEFGAIEARANGAYFRKKNPITAVLPYKDPYYTLSYMTNNADTIELIVTTPSPRYRYFAIEKLRELGFNPTDFSIRFEDFKNPLENTNG